ncbi:MAG: GNAT family N-acetyltransferase [Thermoleophilia bacterium]|nr:GNAT family N-acetyltransferase [Thermoleophilia bacterium]
MTAVRAVEGTGPDAARVVAVARAADPDAPWGEGDFRRHAASEPRHLLLLAADAGADVAAAELGAIEAWDEPDGMWLWLWVLPGHHAGAGAVLWDAVAAHCARHGVTGLRTALPADLPDTLDLLTRHGFREVERQQRVTLPLGARPADPVPPAGITLVRLADDPGLLDGVLALDAECIPDIPGEEGATLLVPGRGWWEERLARGEFDARTIVGAVADGRAVAYTVLRHHRGRPDVADVDFTATLRAWRGRGLAALVKRACHAAAWDAGIREVRSWNDLGNAPMRAVNAALGFTRGPDVLQMRADAWT